MGDILANLSQRQLTYIALVVLAALAGCFKLAAHLYRRTVLTWPSAFLVMGVVLIGSGFLQPLTRGAPLVVDMVVGLAVAVALGAVVLRFRAKTSAGEPLSNADAVKVSAIGYAFLSLVIGAIIGVLLLVM